MKLPRVGEVVAEKYRIDSVVGQGGFAIVYAAMDLTVARVVALKVLKPDESGYGSMHVSRFKREARSLAGLTDPHTVRLFDFGSTETGLMYMAFEMLGGSDLRELLDDEGTLDEPSAIRVTHQILESLREAHGVGLLHRDIKPSNVRVFERVGDPLFVKLIDFGIARSMGDDAVAITRAGQTVGTPRYMSPEQTIGIDLGPPSDLFSVGLVLVEMLAGDPRAPLDGLYAGDGLDIPASPAMKRFAARLLNRDPAKRFQTAVEAMAELTAIAERPAEPPRTPSVAPEPRIHTEPPPVSTGATPRIPWAPALGIAAIVVALGCAVMLMIDRPSDEAPDSQEQLRRALQTPPRAGAGTLLRGNDAPPPEPDRPPEPSVTGRDGESIVSGCGRAAEPGMRSVSGTAGLRRMSFKARLPTPYDPDVEHPVIFLVHGTGGSPDDLLQDAGGDRVIDENGVIVLIPQPEGLNAYRSDADAEAFLELLNHASREYCVDRARIFVVGHDSGGIIADVLSCASWVTAAATTSWRPRTEALPCKGSPLPRLVFSPTLSRHLPLDGKEQCLGYLTFSLEAYEANWQERNACGSKERSYLRRGPASCRTWDCREPFVSCVVEGGHNWPGMTPRRWDVFGCDGTPPEFEYMPAIWEFFESVSSPK